MRLTSQLLHVRPQYLLIGAVAMLSATRPSLAQHSEWFVPCTASVYSEYESPLAFIRNHNVCALRALARGDPNAAWSAALYAYVWVNGTFRSTIEAAERGDDKAAAYRGILRTAEIRLRSALELMRGDLLTDPGRPTAAQLIRLADRDLAEVEKQMPRQTKLWQLVPPVRW